jgi:hypothetical protein
MPDGGAQPAGLERVAWLVAFAESALENTKRVNGNAAQDCAVNQSDGAQVEVDHKNFLEVHLVGRVPSPGGSEVLDDASATNKPVSNKGGVPRINCGPPVSL